jgi:multiple sugar transport system permease protein
VQLPAFRRTKPYRGERGVAWLMLSPATLILLALSIGPIVYLVYMAFHRLNLFQSTPPEPVGWGNFSYLFSQTVFLTSVVRTFKLAIAALGFEIALGFLLAALVFRLRDLPRMGLVRTALTTPILIAPIVSALIWRFMYQADFGVINYLLGSVGIPREAWLSDPQLALWAIAAIDIWQWTPFVFLVILAGMYGLPRSIYEAAELDKTGIFRQIFFITIPMLKRVLIIVLLLRMIDLLRLFDVIVGTTQGGPGSASVTLPVLIWSDAFKNFEMGDSSAESLVLLVLVAAIITVLLRVMSRPGNADQGR